MLAVRSLPDMGFDMKQGAAQRQFLGMHAAIERATEMIMQAEGVDRKTAYQRAVERAEELRRRNLGEPSASMSIKSYAADGSEL